MASQRCTLLPQEKRFVTRLPGVGAERACPRGRQARHELLWAIREEKEVLNSPNHG